MKLDKEWHLANKMPQNPPLEQRFAWHTEHAKHCQCREMPAALKAEIEKRSKKIKTGPK